MISTDASALDVIRTCINTFTSWVLQTDDTYIVYTHDDMFKLVPAHKGHVSELAALHPLLSASMSASLAWFHKNMPSRTKALYADEVRAALDYLTHGGMLLEENDELPLYITRVRSVDFIEGKPDLVKLQCEQSFIKHFELEGGSVPFVVKAVNKFIDIRIAELDRCSSGWRNRLEAHQSLDGSSDDLMRFVFLPSVGKSADISNVRFDQGPDY